MARDTRKSENWKNEKRKVYEKFSNVTTTIKLLVLQDIEKEVMKHQHPYRAALVL